MPKSRLRKNRGKGKGAKASRKARRDHNEAVRAMRNAGIDPFLASLSQLIGMNGGHRG